MNISSFPFARGMKDDRRDRCRDSFTLVELLVAVALIALLASTSLFALYGVMESAKETRTRGQIVKLNTLIMAKWDEYRARPIRLGSMSGLQPGQIADRRVLAIRALMRMELPDRVTDVGDISNLPVNGTQHIAQPSLHRAYQRAAQATLGAGWYQTSQTSGTTGVWSYTHQGSECLYLIVSMTRDGRGSGLDFFTESEIGDVDGDGMKELLDGWGRPIEWLRWAPGFATLPGPDGLWGVATVDDDNANGIDDVGERAFPGSDDESELQSRDASVAADPFDPLKRDFRWKNPVLPNRAPYALVPLIFSAGVDGAYGIQVDYDTDTSSPAMDLFRYASQSNDPYHIIPTSPVTMFGRPIDSTADDNITNHLLSGE